MNVQEEPQYNTRTAKLFYRLRDLFLQKGSVFTAKSINLVPVGLAALLAIGFVGFVLYRLSQPIGQRPGWEKNVIPSSPERLKLTRESKVEEKKVLPSNEELLRRLAGIATPPEPEHGSQKSDRVAPPELVAPRPPETLSGPVCIESRSSNTTTERKRVDEPVDSTMAFEIPRKEEKESKDKLDYEYVNLMAPAGSVSTSDTHQTSGGLPSAGAGAIRPAPAKRSLFQEVRARLLTRIDTSIPGSSVVAEVGRDYDINGFKLRRGNLILGKVALASPRRVAVHFDRLIDRERREYEIQAEALDLAGATGLAAKPADSRLKKGLLYANDRALDYVRAFRGRVSIYNNPVQGDLRQLENKALIVEPNTEFYVVFSRIKDLEKQS